MRIAVCLSGQLRGWRESKHNQLWFWNSCNRENIQVDYFAHTWNYSMDRTGVSQPYVKRKVDEEEFAEFVQHYDIKKAVIDSKPQKEFYNNDHWMGLFYSFGQSLLLKKQYELENNFKYDIVVKSRPDVAFNPKQSFSFPDLRQGMLFTTFGGPMPMEFEMYNINDCVFLANNNTMDLLLNMFFYRLSGVIDSNKEIINIHPLGPGTLIHEFCRDYGITPQELEFNEILIKDGHPKGLDLLEEDDFGRMQAYFQQWYTK